MIKIASIASFIAGILLLVSGAITYGMVASQLSEEKIVVPADSSLLPGAQVRGPLSAYAQAEIIKEHALKGSGGKTYAELGKLANEAKEAGDTAKAEEYTRQRTTVMNGSFLRASLFTSVLAFGVSALVMGLGVLFVIFGLAFWALATRYQKVVTTPTVTSATA